jgi:4-hydroxyphenylpyruvate dioxygenase
MYERLGFLLLGEAPATEKVGRRRVYGQGAVRMLVREAGKNDAFWNAHGDGITALGLEVQDVRQTFDEVVKRGAKVAREPVKFESENGSVWRAEIFTPCDLRYSLMQREPGSKGKAVLFDENLTVSGLMNGSPSHLMGIDHLTNNVSIGEMPHWVEWYKKTFDFVVTRHFDIRTGRTGLTSDVVESRDGRVKVPINQATEKESQVQEFVDRFKGPGVQHLAFTTSNIVDSLTQFRKKGFKFLTVPSTYYEAVPKRVPNVREDMTVLEDLGVLLDGDQTGYLLQIFTEELVGPFFLELIQRKGNRGFGEGNFRALFEAIERDQVRRGVLTV